LLILLFTIKLILFEFLFKLLKFFFPGEKFSFFRMVFELLEAGIFLGGMSFPVGGVSSTTRLEGVAADDVAAVAVAAADFTVAEHEAC
jgi:hypothetical protein